VRGSVLDVLTPYDAALIRETFEHLMLDLWSHAVKPIDTEQDAEPPLKDSREFVRLFGFALKDLHDTCARWRDRAGATRPRWEAAVALLSSLSCTADSLPQGTCGEYIDDINQGGLTFPCLTLHPFCEVADQQLRKALPPNSLAANLASIKQSLLESSELWSLFSQCPAWK